MSYTELLHAGAAWFGFLAGVFAALVGDWLLWDWPRFQGVAVVAFNLGVLLTVWGYTWDWLFTSCLPETNSDEH